MTTMATTIKTSNTREQAKKKKDLKNTIKLLTIEVNYPLTKLGEHKVQIIAKCGFVVIPKGKSDASMSVLSVEYANIHVNYSGFSVFLCKIYIWNSSASDILHVSSNLVFVRQVAIVVLPLPR
jgi:hypothetical protein